MKRLMETNVYAVKGAVIIAGSCLADTDPKGFEEAAAGFDESYLLCLEETHLNMAVTKISAILGTGQVSRLRFASVDRSPHCTQMHYICHEIERTLKEHVPIDSVVVSNGRVIPVSREAIDLSKSLGRLTRLLKEPAADSGNDDCS